MNPFVEVGVEFFGVLALAVVVFYLRVDQPAPEYDSRPPEDREMTWYFSYFAGLVVSVAAFGAIGVIFPIVFRVVLELLDDHESVASDTNGLKESA